MKRILASIGLVLTMSACMASGVQVKEEQLAKFEKGKTTYSQVIETLGKPTSSTMMSNGMRSIAYTYVEAQARPASFIPVVGPLVGGADSRHNMVLLTFDKDGVLQSYTSSEGQTGMGTGFASGTTPQPAENQPRQAP